MIRKPRYSGAFVVLYIHQISSVNYISNPSYKLKYHATFRLYYLMNIVYTK